MKVPGIAAGASLAERAVHPHVQARDVAESRTLDLWEKLQWNK